MVAQLGAVFGGRPRVSCYALPAFSGASIKRPIELVVVSCDHTDAYENQLNTQEGKQLAANEQSAQREKTSRMTACHKRKGM
jgi:hypothetical protein